MKAPLLRTTVTGLLALAVLASSSCMQTYDANGRPITSVDPGLAVAGAVAAGVVGFALADGHGHHGHHHNRRHYNGHRYGRSHYGHGHRY